MGRKAEERERAEQLLNGLDDRKTLKLLREETTLLVLMVRIENQERQAEWERRKQESALEEADALGLFKKGE